jgi:hypothetical protein
LNRAEIAESLEFFSFNVAGCGLFRRFLDTDVQASCRAFARKNIADLARQTWARLWSDPKPPGWKVYLSRAQDGDPTGLWTQGAGDPTEP